MKKINIIINSGHSFFSLRYQLVKFLLKKKISISLFTPNNNISIKKKINSNFFEIKKIKLLGNKKSFFSLFLNCITFYKIFKFRNKNTNIIFGTYLNLAFGIISLFFNTRKNIYVFTGLGSFFNSENKLYIDILKIFFNLLLLRKNSKFLFYNYNDRNFLIKKNLYHKTKIINGSGIEFSLNKKKKKISKGKLKFLFYSRLNYHKGIKELIEATILVNNLGYQKYFELYIFGLFDNNPSSIKKSKLVRMIKFQKNCHFKEVNYRVKIKNIFKDKDVFVLPSYREGLPKSALEAMCYKNALLLSNIPGHSMLINRKNNPNGIFFKVRDKEDLASKIIWSLKNRKKIQNFMNNSHQNLFKFLSTNVNKVFYDTIKKK